ncbi:MAG: ferrous iron transport protein B [Anaerolineales bacterium]|jgi:ferrous iron transport protein B
MHCHDSFDTNILSENGTIALIGHPNVGKSALFQRLTGQHVSVANYPGTTIELTRGLSRVLPQSTLIDTPGVVTFPPHTEDERVTARVLLQEPLKAILQVGDAKNIRRTLLLTVQLAEMGIPMVLALNMMDEAQSRGVMVDHSQLAENLMLTIVPTTAILGEGIDSLASALQRAQPPHFRLDYPVELETTLTKICAYLPESLIARRALALLWLSGDSVTERWLEEHLGSTDFQRITALRERLQLSFIDPLSSVIMQSRLDYVERISSLALLESGEGWRSFSSWFGHLATHPVWGLPLLAIVLYGMYWFVGVFGAGTLVDLFETRLFNGLINPLITEWVSRLIPFPILTDFLVGEYGLWTIGMTYALALIMPIVSTFFLTFGILEDSGYLPRLAALTNRLFRSLGLNGKAVLPMVLGLGCVTMATLTTRVLENKRERLLVTLLLALAVPCSAQLGVVMGLLAGVSFSATLIWGGVVFLVLIAVGWLASKLVPGERTSLLVELPPMRWPMLSNVLVKTLARLEWYLKEVIPLFLLGTALMFLLDKTGILSWVIQTSQPLVRGWLGLPPEASAAFIMGFLRRDFGATGLFVMESQGLLTPIQVVVAMVTITLFIPCIASVMMIAKERSWRTALAMLFLIMPLAFFVGGILSRVLQVLSWSL